MIGITFSRYWERKSEWALCYRQTALVRNNQTNNYAEAAMRVLKDKVFERVKAFNLTQMVDFVLTRLEGYYERKLLDAAHNRRIMKSRLNAKWLEPSSDLLMQIEVSHSKPIFETIKTYRLRAGIQLYLFQLFDRNLATKKLF